jgi:hypothetical protein
MAPKEPPGGGLSKDALFVADVQRRLARAGFSGDVFAVVSRELPEWTRERWERAMRELQEQQAKLSLSGILGDGLRKTLGAICGGQDV